MRRQLRRTGPWLAVLIAALVFLPVVWWNVQNDFASFRFQTTDRLAKGDLGLHWFGQFAFGQIGMLHPLVALALVAAFAFLLRRARSDARAMHLVAFGAPLLGYLLFQSLWIQVKVNWAAPAYVALLLGAIWWWRERSSSVPRQHPAWRWALASLLVVPLLLPFAPAIRLVPPRSGSSWTGWGEIAKHAEEWEESLDQEDQVEGNVFFFAGDYRDAAQLYRNLRLLWAKDGHHMCDSSDPGEPTLAYNVFGDPALQFDYWAQPRSLIGQHAVFVIPRPKVRGELVKRAQARFASVELGERIGVDCMGIDLVDVDIYVCRGYKGPGVKK